MHGPLRSAGAGTAGPTRNEQGWRSFIRESSPNPLPLPSSNHFEEMHPDVPHTAHTGEEGTTATSRTMLAWLYRFRMLASCRGERNTVTDMRSSTENSEDRAHTVHDK